MLFKLEIGRKLEYWEESSPGFFNRGVTAACLKRSGKTPSENERLARVAINSEKTVEQDFIKEVGMKSTEEVVDLVDWMTLRTECESTVGRLSRRGPR